MTVRPKRKAISKWVKIAVITRQGGVCKCGCGMALTFGRPTEWDHSPCLRLRNIAADGLDFDPPQNSPEHIAGLCRAAHAAKTHGTGATTAGSDIGAIKKERKRARLAKKFKRKIQSPGFNKSLTRGFDGKVRVRT